MEDENLTINLKILSPSTELEGGVNLPRLPAATTVKQLRSLIQDVVPSKPATERMRLIYRGRVVANEDDTLGHIFGADNIRESKEQSLHLVLRELPTTNSSSASPAPRSSTAPPNPFRPTQNSIPASPPLQTNPFRTLPQPRPNSQPPHQPHNHHHRHHQLPPLPNPFQVPLPPHVAQAMGMMPEGQPENAQALNTQAQNPSGDAPAAGNGAPAPHQMGLPPLPGFGPPNLPPNGRTVRHEGTGPNGERWMVTYSNTTVPAMPAQTQQPHIPRSFPLPPSMFGPPPRHNASPAPNEAIDRLLPRMAHIMQTARQEMETVRMLVQAGSHQDAPGTPLSPTIPPPWRHERIRQHVHTLEQNLSLVERGLAIIASDSSLADNPDVTSLRQSATELRGYIAELNRTLDSQGNAASGQIPSTQSSQPAPFLGGATSATPSLFGSALTAPSLFAATQPQTVSETLPAGLPEELFIVSSPQGPVGLLFDRRGTYTTAPMVPTLPFQTFSNQFVQNRQLIAGLGQQLTQGSNQLHSHLANVQPTPTYQPTTTEQIQNQAQGPPPQQGQAQDPNPAQNQNANNPANLQGENDRLGNIAGHLWLLFKLACFVYFFSEAGWYRSVLLGMIAGGVYLAQIGMFEEQFNLVRRHFEALLPVGAIAERAAAPQNANANANANAQAQGQQRAERGRNLTPEDAARRILQQQQDQRGSRIREAVRNVERSFAIFVASLWPGIGERMVHAQEERLRLERVAEEERLRLEEEARRKEEEEKQQTEGQKGETANNEGDVSSTLSSSAKGKERADVVESDMPAASAADPSS